MKALAPSAANALQRRNPKETHLSIGSLDSWHTSRGAAEPGRCLDGGSHDR